ncbi:cell lysis protein-like protein [Trematosphaeria pertusa]|uniref:Reticulon-like protein n=1 Tax=Trematosphaeria pertusa TaxID=390896 RepID=A0A6A6IBH1_9PLEO|nr:cell lysis protein-like protein [Trematosphaeria pertusa]KAF2247925.1 cell lysis protein-like protein [Trematosphaeria pertusa]
MSEAAPHTNISDLHDQDTPVPSVEDSHTNGSSHVDNAKNSFMDSQSAMAAVSNHPATQTLRDNISNGPVGEAAKAQSAKTRSEFADLANARQTPEQPAATGQPLTHYHSMFYRLLSWKNPRATAISFIATLFFIFAARYLNLIRYMFKATWMTLGATAAAEVAGQVVLGKGITSQFRPRQYFTIRKASLERLLDDVEQFINFFVIESQRILFAENVYATIAAFFASLVSYFLIKFVPLWGLTLIATTIAYMGPLVYIKNKEAIDAQLEKGYHMANQQATQLRDLAAQHTGNATKTLQGYTREYTTKAQETINQYRGRSTSPEVKKEDFPVAPKHEPASEKEPVAEPAM